MSDPVQYRLPQIPYLHLRFHLSAQKEAYLPLVKSSLLRGAFGHTLRRMVCVMGPKAACETCMLRSQCTYCRAFETFVEGEPPPFLRGLPTAPRPFVFEAMESKRSFRPNDRLAFDLLLFGRIVEMYPYAVYTVSKMAGHGLGKNRYPFKLQEALWHKAGSGVNPSQNRTWLPLFESATERLIDTPQYQNANRADAGALPGPPPPDTARIRFVTPTRLKFKNRLGSDFTFRMLVFKMLRRVLELAHFHVPGAKVDWHFHPLLVAADNVNIVRRDLHWIDWERRSNRQDTTMKMGGFVGEIDLKGSLAPFTELLHICETVHVGKGAVFGNGKIEVSFDSQERQ